ncbi:MAG: sporulation integral membrane protein YtvI [Eubacterium sp.]|nr:sporulation integral membrane protein YtvI [Eubacterium sp.]
MTSKVEKRRAFLINVAFLAVVLGLVYVFFKYMFWAAAPFLLSFFFAVLMQKPIRWLDKITKHKCHGLWSVLLVFLSIAVILLPLILLLAEFTTQIVNFINYLIGELSDFPQFMATLQAEILKLISFLPESIYDSVSETVINTISGLVNDFDLSKIGISAGTVTNTITSGVSGVYSVVKNVPSALIGIVIGIVAWIFFAKDYNYIVKFIKLQLPENKKNLLVEVKQVFSKTILKMVRAYALIMFITFCELAIGLTILNLIGVMNNSYTFIIAIAIAIFDILPVAGSGGILIPWALISLISGNVGQAIGLIVIYIAISAIRQYIEPKIVGDSLGVNPLVTLAGLYFGLKLFGFMGMFIVPILVMTLKAFNDTGRISLWKSIETK